MFVSPEPDVATAIHCLVDAVVSCKDILSFLHTHGKGRSIHVPWWLDVSNVLWQGGCATVERCGTVGHGWMQVEAAWQPCGIDCG